MTVTVTVTCSAAPVEATLAPALTASVDFAARTITGLALPYGVLARSTSAGPVLFAAGSIRYHPDLSRIKLLREHRADDVIGYCTAIATDQTGVTTTFTVAAGPAGDTALAEASARLRDGLSIGVDYDQAHMSTDKSHTIVTSAILREVSLVSLPAYDDARVLTIHASATTPDPTHVDAVQAAASHPADPNPQPTPTPTQDVRAGLTPAAPAAPATVTVPPAPTGPSAAAPAPVTLSTVTHALASTYTHGGSARDLMAALTDIVPAADAGKGYTRPEWLGELWTARRTVRPLVDLFGDGKTLDTLRLYGWRWKIRPTVGTYAGDKAEIHTSPATTEPAETTAYRTAGGWDVDRAFVDLGDPGLIEALLGAAQEDYLAKSEATVTTKVLAAATTIADQPSLPDALNALAGAAGPIGATISTVQFAPDVWTEFLSLTTDDLPWWIKTAGVTVSPQARTATIAGLTLAANDALAPGVVLAADKRAARHREQQLRVQALDVAHGGVDLALFAYEALLIEDPRAIWTTTVA